MRRKTFRLKDAAHNDKDGGKKPPAVVRNNQEAAEEENESRQEKSSQPKKTTSAKNPINPAPPFTPSLLRTPYAASYSSNFISIDIKII